jgi:RND family efflux transporter MFP subunit
MTEPNVSGETVPNSGSEPSAALPEFSKPKRACTSSLSLRQVFYLCLVGLALLLAAWAVWRVSRPPEIPVERLRPETIEISLAVVGTVKPDQLIDVRSPNAGQIAALYLDEGAMIAEGAPMAVVRAVIEYAQVDAAAARQKAATAEVSRARLAFLRTRSLAEKGVAAEAALDEARATFEAAEAELAAAKADRRAADARAGEFTILAPIAGLVLERPVENGQFVSNQTTLFRLGSVEGTELHAEVDEIYADDLRPGMMARAALSGSDKQFSARIKEISPQVDPSTGGRLVKLAPEGGMDLAPGRSVDITIILERRENAITVPRQTIVEATAKPRVYLVDAAGIVRARDVTIEAWPSIDAIVIDGLEANDLVVLDPASVKPGARVRALQGRPGSGASEKAG